jgi:hypothetical protein
MKSLFAVGTRRQRRKALLAVIRHLEAIVDAEIMYVETLPQGSRYTTRCYEAEEMVTMMETMLAMLWSCPLANNGKPVFPQKLPF